MESDAYTATLWYLKEDELWQREKPYHFKYPNPHGPDNNTERYAAPDVLIEDIRLREKPFTIEHNGFTIAKIANELAYADYHDQDRIQPFFRELESLLKGLTGASEVRVFRHAIRKRAPEWPEPVEGKIYDYDQPTTLVHVDATLDGCKQEIAMRLGEEARDRFCQGRYQWFNFWKPLRTGSSGLMDWPLNLCDGASVDKNRDFEEGDLIYPTYATENTQVYHSENHKWYYLSRQKTDEVLIFKQADSEPQSCAAIPHCSTPNPRAPKDEDPRESIEVRAFAFYTK